MSAEIPITYVPARNTIFLSYALAWAEVLGVRDVFIGVNADRLQRLPRLPPEFIAAFETMANLATKMTTMATHVQNSRPADQVDQSPNHPSAASDLSVNYSLTHSCYDPDPMAAPAADATVACCAKKDSPKPMFRSHAIYGLNLHQQICYLLCVLRLP